MGLWYELLSIIEDVHLNDESDQIIWSFSSNGKFSVQSLYAVINHHGVTPVYVRAVWKLTAPPRVQIFLWLLSKNKLLTRDNLAKRREVSDNACLFCSEPETIHPLFFDCCIAQALWAILSNSLDLIGIWSFEYVATLWLANKRHLLTNAVIAAALWCLWKLRNKLCFQGAIWTSIKELVLWITKTLRRWKALFCGEMEEKLILLIQKLEMRAASPPGVGWSPIKSTNIGISAFGSGLQRCDSAEF